MYAGKEIGPVKLALGVNTTVASSIDGNDVLTGYLSGFISVMYPFNVPSINFPFKWW